ncbi:MAG TPA: hypothetical protein VLW26_13345 [Steroidobacteraceae bacterium]|nr:hypothetical protein [Steroidobacteraceae bacterium]
MAMHACSNTARSLAALERLDPFAQQDQARAASEELATAVRELKKELSAAVRANPPNSKKLG